MLTSLELFKDEMYRSARTLWYVLECKVPLQCEDTCEAVVRHGVQYKIQDALSVSAQMYDQLREENAH